MICRFEPIVRIMEKKQVIAVDVDGVLRDNLGVLVSLYNETFHDSKQVKDVTEYRTDLVFPRIFKETGIPAREWFFQMHSNEVILEAGAFPDVARDIELLREHFHVAIVTAQDGFRNKYQTLQWLDRHDIHYDSLLFTANKSLIDCYAMVDDYQNNFIGSKASVGCLIDAPYNGAVNLEELKLTSRCKSLYRKPSFHDFVTGLLQ